MKMLLCSRTPLDAGLGAAQTLLELAAALRRRGQRVDLAGPDDYGWHPADPLPERQRKLYRFVRATGTQYDVLDYDHTYLPFPRQTLPPGVLCVARSQLLAHHILTMPAPRPRALAGRLRHLLAEARRQRTYRPVVRGAQQTLRAADLVLLLNRQEQATLAAAGVAREKLCVLPNGLSRARHDQFARLATEPPAVPRVAFIGTFTARKGAPDLPEVLADLAARIPDVRLRLLGVHLPEADVRRCFPAALRTRVEVVPTYPPETLPALLADCSLGVFPSYLEGFGLGVLEMLAAALPVVAYACPGPPEMLPPRWLVPTGDTRRMAEAASELLADPAALAAARRWARRRSGDFDWDRIAGDLMEAYETHHRRLAHPPVLQASTYRDHLP